MQKTIIHAPMMQLVGITCRTSNALEMDVGTAQIGATLGRYMGEMAAKLKNRKRPGITYVVYHEYESDIHGPYTYFIGEEVTDTSELAPGLISLVVPAQKYVRFTTNPGQMPQVCINAWQEIWKMTDEDFGSSRAYIADLELYDERSADPQNTVMDICIGVK
ncbi:MAG: GyrI-like domain-containing protein [Proteobacteria bacterium]|nr:GyrI-like domain-containing protein [Pseudomonadota bacterium]